MRRMASIVSCFSVAKQRAVQLRYSKALSVSGFVICGEKSVSSAACTIAYTRIASWSMDMNEF